MSTQPAYAPLTVSIRRDGEVVHLGLAGDLDYQSTSELLDRANEQLDAGARQLRVDCSGLGFCDTMGLSGLLDIRRRTIALGCELHLDSRPPQLQRVLEITGSLQYLAGVEPPAAGHEHHA
jgi:anti-anti-sigma factor